MDITPYLFFGGRCREALDFYAEALGAQFDFVMNFSESPDPIPLGKLAEGFEDKVMHASFRVGGTAIMASDGCDEKSKFEGFRLALSVAGAKQAEQAFEALAVDGSVEMPLGPTFWSPCYGMVTDRFGIGWMVMVPGDPAS